MIMVRIMIKVKVDVRSEYEGWSMARSDVRARVLDSIVFENKDTL